MKEVNNIHFITFEKVNIPTINATTGSGAWVNYDSDNLYPQRLEEYRTYSPAHNSVLTKMADMISGAGLRWPVGPASKLFELSKADTLLDSIANDLVLFGGFAIECLYLNGSIYKLNHIPFASVRAARPKKGETKINNYILNPDWKNYKKYDFIELPSFDYSRRNEEQKQLLYIKLEKNSNTIYPIAPYQSALGYVLLSKELETYLYSSVKNNFAPSALISIFGKYTDEQKRAISKQFDDAHTGSSNAGKRIINFIEGTNEQKIVEIENLTSIVKTEDFQTMLTQAEQQIVLAHGFNPLLAGLPSSNTLGSDGNAIYNSWSWIYNTTIKNYQNCILNTLYYLLELEGIEEELVIKTPEFISSFQNTTSPATAPVDTTQLNNKLAKLESKLNELLDK